MITKFKIKNRVLSMLLAVVLVFSMIPMNKIIASAGGDNSCAETNCTGTYQNGFCTECNDYQKPVLNNNGYYEISNAGNLYWFSIEVETNKKINAVLTEDIDLNPGYKFASDGTVTKDGVIVTEGWRNWEPIGLSGYNEGYKGVFDGNFHTVSGMYCISEKSSKDSYLGLFSSVAGGTITKVGVDNGYVFGTDDLGGIVGAVYGGVISKCWNEVTVQSESDTSGNCFGGITGNNQGVIENCYNLGLISGRACYLGGIAGSQNTYLSGTKIINCYNMGEVIPKGTRNQYGQIVGEGGGRVYNCYYLSDSETDSLSGTTAATTTDFRSGKVTYLLNQGVTDGSQVWYQTCGEKTPAFIGKTVYAIMESCYIGDTVSGYTNEVAVSPAHKYDENGFCENLRVDGITVCDAYQPCEKNANGSYEISNAGQLYWFAQQVNEKEELSANAVLTANIKVNEDLDAVDRRNWIPIGNYALTGKKYSGTFDGQGYTIRGLYCNQGNSLSLGLFGVCEKSVLQNIRVESSYFHADQSAGVIAGNVLAGTRVINCHSVDNKIIINRYTAGGVIGYCGDGAVEHCSNTSTVTHLDNEDTENGWRSGGIVGFTSNTVITNCWNSGEISARNFAAGGIVGGKMGDLSIENCYNVGKVTLFGGGTGSRVDDPILGMSYDSTNPGVLNIVNCYYLEDNYPDSTKLNGATEMKKNAFESGEVTYLLNGSKSDGELVWYQTLTGDEKQNYPSFNGKTVYRSNGQYVNAQIITITGVTAANGEYNGKGHIGYTGTATNEDGYTGTYEVKYTGRNNTTYSSTEAPTNAGDYTVTIRTDSSNAQYIGSVSLEFTIAKKDVTVTAATQKIAKGESLSTGKVTVGTLLEGHTASVSAVTKGANCKYTATVVIKDGNENDVTANYSFDATGTYHEYDWDTATHGYKCINCTDIDKTDSDMPTAEYQIGTSGFKKFINTITFGLFCKDYKTVKITSKDATSGVKTTQYYISGKELSETELADVTWNDYADKLSLNAKGTYFIYVKVTDKAGNSAVYNSEGIVIFEDSTASVDIEYTRTTNTDVKANIDFNGNTVKEVKYGTSVLTKGTDYTVANDGITFTAKFLETLAASDSTYTVTVSYNAGGVEWGNDSYGTKAADTAIAITVKLATSSVTGIEDVSKTYDGNAVSNPIYTSLSTGNATYEYKVKGADDSTYTATAPKTVGKYTVRVTVAADTNYKEAFATADFTISAKEITVAIIGKSSIYGDEIKSLTAQDNGIVNGDTNVYSLFTTASKNASVGYYDITGTALDDNYIITFMGGEKAYEITKRNLTVTVVVDNKQYDGLNTASIKSVKLNNVANNDSITLVNGTPTFSSVNVANGIGIAFTEFSLSGAADVLKNYTLTQPTGITANITNGWNPVKDTEYTASTLNTNGWLNADLVITAKNGYELSLANTADGTWENTLTGATEGADNSLKFYVRNKATGTISEQVTVNYKLDKNTETTGTTGKVEFVDRSSWQSFVNIITFGLFYKDEVTVKAEATDKLSGVDSIEYAVSDKALTLEQVKEITDWTVMSENGVGVTVEDEKTFVYFIRITDKAGNVTYLSTDGAEYDTTLPAISGIENGATYHTTKVITVTDKNLESVTLNSETVTLGSDGKLTMIGNIEETYTITVTDKAGNVTEYTVTMKAIADITDSIKDITVDDVTSDDKENIETVIKDIEEELKNDDLTDEEKAELEDEKQKAEDLIKKIEEAIGSTETDNTDKVKDVTPDNVKPEEKKDLEKAKDDLEKTLTDYKDNLTDDEKKDIEDEIERIEDALDVIEKVENVEDLINKLPDNITKSDADAIKKADEAYNALSKYEQSILDKNAKKKLDNAKSVLETLNKATNSPTTGDTGTIWLWFVLLFVSGGILGTTTYRRKRNRKL